MSKPNNPPAFPQQSIYRDGSKGENGMTLLDYFAGQALVAVVSNSAFNIDSDDDEIAYNIWCLAEAMLRERKDRV